MCSKATLSYQTGRCSLSKCERRRNLCAWNWTNPLPQLRVLWVTKLLYAGEAWVVLTAPATAGIQDPVVYQLHKDFCTWPPDRLYHCLLYTSPSPRDRT